MTATAERYVRATRSSHLRMKEESGDVDTLVAAGMARESLGVSLLRLRAQYDATARPATDSSLTAHLLILINLPGLVGVREHLGEYGETLAAALRTSASKREIQQVAGLVLDVLLDPSCRPCGGLGFTGVYGVPRLRCAVCRETGKRRIEWRDVHHLAEFGLRLLDDANWRMDHAEHRIKKKLRE